MASFIEYNPLPAGQSSIVIPVTYLKKADIIIQTRPHTDENDGEWVNTLAEGTGYSFTSSGTIQLVTAGTGAFDCRLLRKTQRAPVVSQQAGVISSDKINLTTTQQQYVNEEQDDALAAQADTQDGRWDRTLRLPPGYTSENVPPPQPNSFLGTNAGGQPAWLSGTGGGDAALRNDLGSRQPGVGAGLVALPGIAGDATLLTYLDDVMPEQFALGVGLGIAAIDTFALQAAVNTGRKVKLRGGTTYYINAEIKPPTNGGLFIEGAGCLGTAASKLQAAAGFTGWMLRPVGTYVLRNFSISGNGLRGCYLIGSNDNLGAGVATIEDVAIGNADIGIFFDWQWEHPFQLRYNGIAGTGFMHGGICLGGVSGAASSGESAWSMDNVCVNGAPNGPGIPAQDISVAPNSPNATTDRITWTNANPIFGYTVMRSADGSTGWHVPPNWASDGLFTGTFDAAKASGETWSYMVVETSRGVSLRRGKVINLGVIQAEYFTIGTHLRDINVAQISQHYSETRNFNPPLGQFTSIWSNNTSLTVGGLWSETYGYGLVSWGNSIVAVLGGRVSSKWATFGLGGATLQNIIEGGPVLNLGSAGGQVQYKSLSASAFDTIHGGWVRTTSNSLRFETGGATDPGLDVKRREVLIASLQANAEGYGELIAHKAKVTTPNKNHQAPLRGTQTTSLAVNAASNFLTVSGVPAGASVELEIAFNIEVRDGGSVLRHGAGGRLSLWVGDGNISNFSAQTLLAQGPAGALTGVTFAVSMSGGVATVSCNVATNGASASIRPVVVSAEGAQATLDAVVITQL